MKHMLDVKRFAVSCGLFWALSILLLSLFANVGYGIPWVELFGSAYRGYDLTSAGVALGVVYGFIDGLIGGAVFAWIYNWVGMKMGNKK